MKTITINLVSGKINDFTTTHDIATDADATYLAPIKGNSAVALKIEAATLDDTDGTITWVENVRESTTTVITHTAAITMNAATFNSLTKDPVFESSFVGASVAKVSNTTGTILLLAVYTPNN